MVAEDIERSLNFIENIIEDDLANGFSRLALKFRFPPEPNGYLHIGHAKSICLNFGLGIKYNAPVNLRFDDTNPAKEEAEYVNKIKEDIQWLGFDWDKECYASDYFQQLYDWAVELVKRGKAYVDSQSSEAIAEQKGTPTKVGVDSPFRSRSVKENLELLKYMKSGSCEQGKHVLRAKIDMNSKNMLMRDPIMYRVFYKTHHRTNATWCIYPMYDWTHGQSDFLEQISHSLCTLEFDMHRELYNWFLHQLDVPKTQIFPRQFEFARLNISYTILSKRSLSTLVEKQIVTAWDDPRMPTISGLRRRGYPPEAIKSFCEIIGVAKRENMIDISLLEHCARVHLNKTTTRVMVVQKPLKIVIVNYPEKKVEWLAAENNPEAYEVTYRKIPFTKVIYIEQDDFREVANRKFFRLKLGGEVRLKNGYIIKAESVIKNTTGEVTEVHCTYDKESKSGSGTEASQRKVKATIHWVSATYTISLTINKYDKLFTVENPNIEEDILNVTSPNSLEIIKGLAEINLRKAKPYQTFQFQRLGYYCVDKMSDTSNLIFNHTVSLKDYSKNKTR